MDWPAKLIMMRALNDLQSMQNNIGLMQRQLEAAANTEKELEEILLSEIPSKKNIRAWKVTISGFKSKRRPEKAIVEIESKRTEPERKISRL